MSCKKRSRKVHQICDYPVVGICPKRSKLKTVAGFCAFSFSGFGFFDGVKTSAVGVVLRISAVGDDEDLHVFVQSAACPKAISLVTVNLVERLSNRYATAFQLDVYQRESVHQNGHIVTVVMLCPLGLGDLVLVDDLQEVVVDVLLIDEGNVLGRTIVPPKHLYIVFLNLSGFLYNALVLVCKCIFEKAFPLVVRKGEVVQLFQLCPQVGDKVALFMECQTLVALFCQHLEKSFFQIMLGLVAAGLPLLRFVFCDNGVFCGLCHKVKKGHCSRPP